MAAQGGNAPPSVRLVAPLDGDEYADPSEIVLRVEASDSDGAVEKVEFFEGTNKLGECVGDPFVCRWRWAPGGTYALTARATDDAGAASTSTVVTVFVREPPRAVVNPARRDFYVAPMATAQGDGSYANPWTLETALNHPATLHPGDTIWLRGGTYGTGGPTMFMNRLNGATNDPIRVRRVPGERAIIDGGINATLGSWVWWEDFEILNSSTERVVYAGNDPWHPVMERPYGIAMAGRGMRAINLIVHDVGHPGIGFWKGVGDGGEIHGCLIWAIGYYDIDCTCTPHCPGAHTNDPPYHPFPSGSGIYAQNQDGTRFITDVISFRNLTCGIKPYASGDNGYADGFHVEDCDMFDNGDMNLFFTAHANPAKRAQIVDNTTWRRATDGQAGVRIGYQGTHDDISLRGNYMVNGVPGEMGFYVRKFRNVRVTDNTIVSRTWLAQWDWSGAERVLWDRNAYHGGRARPFSMPVNDLPVGYDLAAWRTETCNDLKGTHDPALPTETRVFVRRNRYEPGRGHVTICNWSLQPAVAVDLSGILSTNEPYEVRDAQNYLGAPVASGTYAGGTVAFPMNLTVVAPSTGDMGHGPNWFRHTAPEYAVFVVQSRKPNVRIDATKQSFKETGETGAFTVWRAGDTNQALTVNYNVGGTATPGTDYAALTGAVQIAAGELSATIMVTPTNDAAAEAGETVQVTLTTNGSAYYVDAGAGVAHMTIVDDDGIGAGLLGHWPLDEGAGSLLTRDISGNGNDGTVVDGTWIGGGHFGGALRLDGSHDYVRLTTPVVANRAQYTVCAWVRTAGGGTVYGEGKSLNSGPYIRFQAYGSTVSLQQRDDANVSVNVSGAATINDSNWHHVALVRESASACRLYCDGVLKGSSSSPALGQTTVDNALIGAGYRQSMEVPFGGDLDDVRIYDRALSATELADVYQQANPFESQAPSAPANLTLLSKTWASVTFAWSAATDNVGVAGYRVYRDGAPAATVTGTEFTDIERSAGTPYVYTVKAYDCAGNVSPASPALNVTTEAGPDLAPPSVPASVWVTDVGTNSVTLAWAPSTDNVAVAGYKIFRNRLQKGLAAGTCWTNAGLLPSTVYTYTVRAFDAAGNLSGPSPSVSGKTLSSADQGMVACWPMNEGSGASVDDTKGSKDGTVVGGATWVAGAPGLRSYALQVGGDKYVSLAGTTVGGMTDAYTLSAWVRVPSNATSAGDIYGEGSMSSGGSIVRLRVNSPSPGSVSSYHRGESGGAGGANAAVNVNDGLWHHVATSLENGNTFKLYFDGSWKATGPEVALGASTVDDARIGAWKNVYYEGGFPAGGEIDDVRIYNRTLSPGEVAELYTIGITADLPPAVSLTSPMAGSVYTVPAEINILASAADDVRLDNVAFYEGTNKLGDGNDDLAPCYSYRWSGVAAGVYSLTAVGTDSLLQMTTSLPVTVTVSAGAPGNAPPAVALTSPANGTRYSVPAGISLAASVDDSDGTIAKVEFVHDAIKVGEDVTAPYSFVWTGVGDGSYVLAAQATDDDGAVTTSDAILVRVTTMPTSGLVAYWALNETNGATAFDSSGKNNHAALTNAPTRTNACMGNGLSFDGTGVDDYVQAPNSSSLQNVQEGDYTLAAWVKPLSLPPGVDADNNAAYGLVMKQGYHEGLLYGNTGAFGMYHYLGDTGVGASSASFEPGQFYHVAGVVTVSGSTKIYVNGVLSGSRTWTPAAAREYGTTPWRIGIAAPDFDYYRWPAHAVIDEVKIFNRALSASEVDALMAAPSRWLQVSLSSPTNRAVYTAPANIPLAATVMPGDGTVTNVAFLSGTTLLANVKSPPYAFTWSNVATGDYVVTAVAADDTGVAATSGVANVRVVERVNNPPAVAITAPAQGAAFAAPAALTIAVTASDGDGSVANVALYRNGVKLADDAAAPYLFVWSNVATGSYSLTAVATDNEGASNTSAPPVGVVVSLPPVVSLMAPANGTVCAAPAAVELAATASDADGTVAKVAFYGNTVKLGEDAGEPFTCTWMGVRAGSYQLTAVATDNHGVTATSSPPVGITVTGAVVTVTVPSVSAGIYHTMALGSDGAVRSWGRNLEGRLGDGTVQNRSSPVSVVGLADVIAIGAGNFHSIALAAYDPLVWACGGNAYGEVGDGTNQSRLTPVPLTGFTNVTAIAAGYHHSVALKADGTVWAWGRNSDGQLGDGTTGNRNVPVRVSGLDSAAAVDAGAYHTLAVRSDGAVWAWGQNSFGELGIGATGSRSLPVQVLGLGNAVAVAAGYQFSAALRADGTVWAWGDNTYGQLGDGTTTNRFTPVQVLGISNAVAVTLGDHHTLVLKRDGTVWGCGANYYGQLGDGTTAHRSTLVPIGGISSVVALDGGGGHSAAMTLDGAVWTWGWNRFGQLGDGTTADRFVPARLTGLNLGLPSAGPPLLTILTPADCAYRSSDWVTVAGNTASSLRMRGVTVNTHAASSTDGFAHWTYLATGLSVGTNTLKVIAQDMWQRAATGTVRVIYAVGAYDGNGDGIPDAWQMGHFGTGFITNADAGRDADPDHDGMLNWQEWQTGTDPQNGVDRLAVTTVNPSSSGAVPTLEWRSVSGHVYEVQWSSNLAGWTSFAPAVTAAAPSASATDPDAGRVTNRFYRVRQP